MQLYRHMPLKHSVYISRAAYVGSQRQGVERADKVMRRFTAKLFCFVGHLCGFRGGWLYAHEELGVVHLDLRRNATLKPVLNTLDAAGLLKLQEFCNLGGAAQAPDKF